jgi:hypothetical protein
MKHDLDGFSHELVRLIKTSGDTGGSGDKSKQRLRQNDFFVPTCRAAMSPLVFDWDRGLAATGDNKSKHSETVAERVPSVPTATTYFRIAQPMEAGGSFPEEWHAILAGLKRSDSADWLSPEQWRGLLCDAENFLTRWGSAAHLLGWTSLDLFGVHPIAPAARFDVMGLIPILNGAEVLALTSQTATIRRSSGAIHTYRRPDHGGAIVLPIDRGPAAVTSTNSQM